MRHLTINLHLGDQGREEHQQIMAQIDDLRAAIAQLSTDLSEAVARVDEKVSRLGDPDPDLAADIAALRDASTRLDALQADVPPDTGGGTDPGPGPGPAPDPTTPNGGGAVTP